jgi:regulator of protease activity HflC (stomatin/prohibitin superfamily)
VTYEVNDRVYFSDGDGYAVDAVVRRVWTDEALYLVYTSEGVYVYLTFDSSLRKAYP